MCEELAEEMITINSYQAFPRILTVLCLERVFKRWPQYPSETQEALDLFANDLYRRFLLAHFVEKNNVPMKPFDEKHKVLIRKMQVVLCIASYFRSCKYRLTKPNPLVPQSC